MFVIVLPLLRDSTDILKFKHQEYIVFVTVCDCSINDNLFCFQINLKHGISDDIHDRNRDTCTACAGTIILEFAALSRLTNEEIFEVCNITDKKLVKSVSKCQKLCTCI